MKEKLNTIDPEEIDHFSRLADSWWDPLGKFKPLHQINPLRIGYIRDQAAAHFQNASGLAGRSLLDIGCGGGLICEPMARLGARVTGIDASEKNIAVAKLHAEQSGLEIDYRCMPVEELGKENASALPLFTSAPLAYDIVLALEIIEHVADVEAFIAASCTLVKPGGLIIYSTINRTFKSFALAIVGAEYVLRLIPRGTHDWNKFLRPHELVNPLRSNGIEITGMTGMKMNPLTLKWELDAKDVSVNYLVAGRKV